MIGKDGLLQLGDEPRRAEDVAETRTGHGPRFGEGAGHNQRGVVIDQVDSGVVSELAVCFVDHEEPAGAVHDRKHLFDRARRVDDAARVVWRAEKQHFGRVLGDHSPYLVEVEAVIVSPISFDDRGTNRLRNVSVHCKGGLEQRRLATHSPVGEQQCLQHLVRAVRDEDFAGVEAVALRETGP